MDPELGCMDVSMDATPLANDLHKLKPIYDQAQLFFEGQFPENTDLFVKRASAIGTGVFFMILLCVILRTVIDGLFFMIAASPFLMMYFIIMHSLEGKEFTFRVKNGKFEM